MAAIIPAAFALPLGLLAVRSFAQDVQGPPKPHNSLPPFPDDPSKDAGPKIDPKAILKHNKEQIHQDVEKLFCLATELKEKVDKTDSAIILSLPLIQKAEEIEKLAKQIKNMARG
ncbi:MAG: hypothetical protein WBP79_15805 [Candidatus Acidiferrales bacterium]